MTTPDTWKVTHDVDAGVVVLDWDALAEGAILTVEQVYDLTSRLELHAAALQAKLDLRKRGVEIES